MRTIRAFFHLFIFFVPFMGVNLTFSQNITIPDTEFKEALIALGVDTNNDSEISQSEALAKTGVLNLSNKGITDLTGIAYFTAITELNCNRNELTSLNISANTALTKLSCAFNKLTSLNVTENTVLVELNFSDNRLTSIDLSENTALTRLYCHWNRLTSLDLTENTALVLARFSGNRLTSLDVSESTALTELNCSSNRLTSLDVTENTNLTKLDCRSNRLTSLDVTENENLTELDCGRNKLTSLDVSENTDLEILDCSWNSLTSLNISENTDLEKLDCSWNLLTSLDLSENDNLDRLDSEENPYLPCIKVSSVTLANRKIFWEKDPTISYYDTGDCPGRTPLQLGNGLSLFYNTQNVPCIGNTEGATVRMIRLYSMTRQYAWGTRTPTTAELITIPTENIALGIYFLEIFSNRGVFVKRIVKQ